MATIDKLVGEARRHLERDERIEAAVSGVYETKIGNTNWVRKGVLLATDRRIVFFAKKLMGFDLESFPYGNISSVEHSKGMMGHAISFFASGNTVMMKWIREGTIEGFIRRVRAGMGHGSRPQTSAQLDPIDQVRRLAELRDQGILSEEEFQL